MKKLFLMICCLTGTYLFAQTVQQTAPMQSRKAPALRLHVYTAYAFDDQVDSYYSTTAYYKGTIKGGFEWGGGLEYLLSPAYGIEAYYLRLDSKANLVYYNVIERSGEFDLASNYVMLGGNRYLVLANPRIEPYGGLQIGMGIFDITNPETDESASAVKFAWGLKAGINIWASDRVGIKLQAGLLSVVQSVGGSLYFGTGGAGAGVASYSTIYQWTLGGGLTFNLSK
jgi:hypothetical protein